MTDHSRHKQTTADSFGDAADQYLSSETHGSGKDLDRLVEWCEGATVALDVATGAGHTAGALAKAEVPVVVAVDASPSMVRTTESAFDGVRGVLADAEQLPFSAGSFDAVTCRIAAHHFPDPEAFVSEVARVIRPHGTFAFEDNVVPEERDLGSFSNRVEELRDPTHVEAYRTSVWRDWLAKAGFDVEETEHFKKKLEFESWVNRQSIDAERRERVRQLLLEAPAAAVDCFDIQRSTREGSVQSFLSWKAVIRATRVP